MRRVAIIGGGPSGLITAYRLCQRIDDLSITLFEGSEALGGKLRTERFNAAPVPYEAGAAECYDYAHLGADPLRALVQELGLETAWMTGQTVVARGVPLRSQAEVRAHLGEEGAAALDRFLEEVRRLLPIERWHPGDWRFDRDHPWTGRDSAQLFQRISHPGARRLLKFLTHSDIAAEHHRTSGLNGLKNVVVDLPDFLRMYRIVGGMSEFARRLVTAISEVRLRCETRILGVEALASGRYRLRDARGETGSDEFDVVILALPAIYLSGLSFEGEHLAAAMERHLQRFDHPGHYLRVSALFERPFWKEELFGSWFMTDAFGGTCIYDESGRDGASQHGVLGFLLAGNDALRMGNLANEELVERVIGSLPPMLVAPARSLLLETRVHRWAGGVSAEPGGRPPMDPMRSHQPDGDAHPGLYVVGDYLFDSTLNGACRSAELVAGCLTQGRRVLAKSA